MNDYLENHIFDHKEELSEMREDMDMRDYFDELGV